MWIASSSECSHLVTWRCIGCGFILDLSVCIGDLETDRMWIDS